MQRLKSGIRAEINLDFLMKYIIQYVIDDIVIKCNNVVIYGRRIKNLNGIFLIVGGTRLKNALELCILCL
jgi:hypothetical protein